MSTTFESVRALIPADAESIQRADSVIRSINLPSSGIAVQDPATAETIAHVPDHEVKYGTDSVRWYAEADSYQPVTRRT